MKNALNTSSHIALIARLGGLATVSALLALSAGAVIPNDNDAPGDIFDDEVDVTGIGAQLNERGDNCTGTLINPRTVIFAAHCVDSFPARNYGTGTNPDYQLAFAFKNDVKPGHTRWKAEDSFQTNVEDQVYTVNQIQIHRDYFTSREADVAIATLDTPASNVPTWAVLFSPLPAPDEIDPETGTGYHVDIIGYGRTGTGSGGRENSDRDMRRRAAENMLGALTSDIQLHEFQGQDESPWPAFRYYIDFDDPNKENRVEENRLRDEALEHEGIGSSGDSGGPLILDARNNEITQEDLLLGTFSSSNELGDIDGEYGTYAYYQPLFLYRDWIVEANPYRYVSAKPGTGEWEDPEHWISELDPNYRYIDENGDIVSGLPERVSWGVRADGPGFGQFCDQSHPRDLDGNTDECESAANENPSNGWWKDEALPSPTLENGLPGATGFVPNNVDPNPRIDINGRYFDVTLGGYGVTSVSSDIEIDKLTLREDANLSILDGGHLTSLASINQIGRYSFMIVDGRLSTSGDYLLAQGYLLASGTIEADYFTNVAGTLVPNELTIDGDIILSSGSTLVAQQNSDNSSRLNVTGDIDLGGVVSVWDDAHQYRDSHRIIDFGGEATNAFDVVALLDSRTRRISQGVLFGTAVERDNSIYVDVDASSLTAHLPNFSTDDQREIGDALDESREEHFEALKEVYTSIDTLDPFALSGAFEQMVPTDAMVMGEALFETGMSLDLEVSTRLKNIRQHDAGLTFAGSTSMLESRGRSSNGSHALEHIMFGQESAQSEVSERTNGLGGFATISAIDPDPALHLSQMDTDMQGYSIAAGVDQALQNGAVIGIMASYVDAGNGVGSHIAATDEQVVGASFGFYGTMPVLDDYFADAYVSFGQYSTQSGRTSSLSAAPQTLTADASTEAVMSGVTFGRQFQFDNGMNLTPQVGVMTADYDISNYVEHGSVAALDIQARTLSSTQIRFGAEIDWQVSERDNIRPAISVSLVEELEAGPDVIRSRFAAAPGAVEMEFTGDRTPASWAEINASLAFELTPSQSGSFGLRQTVSRGYRPETLLGGSYRIKF